jgi:hypothetical protein
MRDHAVTVDFNADLGILSFRWADRPNEPPVSSPTLRRRPRLFGGRFAHRRSVAQLTDGDRLLRISASDSAGYCSDWQSPSGEWAAQQRRALTACLPRMTRPDTMSR